MKTIIVTVSSDGKSVVETSGYSGPSCQEASRFLEQALGQKQSESLKSEYFANINNTTEQSEGTS